MVTSDFILQQNTRNSRNSPRSTRKSSMHERAECTTMVHCVAIRRPPLALLGHPPLASPVKRAKTGFPAPDESWTTIAWSPRPKRPCSAHLKCRIADISHADRHPPQDGGNFQHAGERYGSTAACDTAHGMVRFNRQPFRGVDADVAPARVVHLGKSKSLSTISQSVSPDFWRCKVLARRSPAGASGASRTDSNRSASIRFR